MYEKYRQLLLVFYLSTIDAFDMAQPTRPRWVRIQPGVEPVYSGRGETVMFRSSVSQGAAKPGVALTTDWNILAVSPEGICGYDVYDNPANHPVEKMFTVCQEYSGSGRGVIYLTKWGAEALGHVPDGTTFTLDIMASSCKSGLKVGAVVIVTVGDEESNRESEVKEFQITQSHNEILPHEHTVSKKHRKHHHKFRSSENMPMELHYRKHIYVSSKSVPVRDEASINEAIIQKEPTTFQTINLALGANATAFVCVLVVLGAVLFWRHRMESELNTKYGNGANKSAEKNGDFEPEAGKVNLTLNPFLDDSFLKNEDDEVEEIDLEETQELKEYNFENALRLTIYDSFDNGPVGDVALEWDDEI